MYIVFVSLLAQLFTYIFVCIFSLCKDTSSLPVYAYDDGLTDEEKAKMIGSIVATFLLVIIIVIIAIIAIRR